MNRYRIAVIKGDGIGHEVVPEAIRVLEEVSSVFGIDIQFDYFPWGCDYYLAHGRMMPKDGLEQIAAHDAILLGAVGYPTVPDHISLWGLLIAIRRGFDQYANVRPVRLMKGLNSPLKDKEAGDIDFVIVRENSEGEYSSLGGIENENTPDEVVKQTSVFSRRGVDRVIKYAFEIAEKRARKHLTSATKSNGVAISMPYWDSRFAKMSKNFPDIATDQQHIDIFAARMVMKPESFDVIVASNLFGDILSDLGPACAGTIAIAPSANINPSRKFPSMFEPVHGSAPDIFGKNIANPIGQIWSAAMMMDHLGEHDVSNAIVGAIEVVLESGPRTPDLGGTASTQEVGAAIARQLVPEIA